jgi:hypothetical protein
VSEAVSRLAAGPKARRVERLHATASSSCFDASRHRKTAAHPRFNPGFKPEGMLLRDMH